VFVCFAESAKSRQHDSVAAVRGAYMKLDRCVVESKMHVEFEDGCSTSSYSLNTQDVAAGLIPSLMALSVVRACFCRIAAK